MMNTNILNKLLIALIVTIISLSFILISYTNASNENSIHYYDSSVNPSELLPENDINDTEEKIIQYDAETGKRLELDKSELANEAKKITSSKGIKYNTTSSYIPKFQSSTPLQQRDVGTYYYINNMTGFPYRTICRIKYYVNGDEYIASGFMVASNLLLTAAHCVMNNSNTGYSNWTAYPGYMSGTSYNNVSSGWSQIYYSSNWANNHNAEDDWCLCKLNSSIGSQTGWMGCQSYGTNSEMNGLSVRAVGYPENPGGGEYQYYTSGSITATYNKYFSADAVVSGGMSGGPVARGDAKAVGIVRGYYTNNPNLAFDVRITQTIIDLINNNS